ncbi:MAG: phospholipid/cholesterol/gamma-HCH transport system substrate-binding protein [Motiliproteus sp.]|jgi:phospholipid/cholesterol/gamma-HCH transport system substrate-binding protein
MRMRTLELSVGTFMLAGLVALAVLIVNVSGLSLSGTQPSYTLYALFENAGGLTERSKVSMSGVLIGEVTAITIDKKLLKARVEMKINKDANYLSYDTSAAILTAGLLGEKYIGVTVGADEELLRDGDTIGDTQSSLVLEELIGKFLFNKVTE